LEQAFPPYKLDPQDPDVWSYEDKMVYQKFKLQNFRASREKLISVDVNSGKVREILNESEEQAHVVEQAGDLMVIQKGNSWYLQNTVTLKRSLIKAGINSYSSKAHFSPDRKYMIYYDGDLKTWRCYDIIKESNRSFAERINIELFYYSEMDRKNIDFSLAIFGWVEGTDHVIMQGTHELWEVSVTNEIQPRKLTPNDSNEELVFSLAIRPTDGVIRQNENLYVYSQNLVNRNNTLYRLNLRKSEFKTLHSGNFYWAELYNEISKAYFQKAENADAFLFVENRVDESTNYLFTKDFKSIIKISNNHPEKNYNWMKSELMTYKDIDNNYCQAILYKPENFDKEKKYPVIMYVYQDQSIRLNKHVSPVWSGAGINIPYLVSNGYLVCRPNVYIEKGKIGEFAVKSVLAAADHLSKLNWVDSTKLGLTGHSLGGFETEYIVSSSNRFAAAISFAGVSSMINLYNELWGESGEEKQSFTKYSTPSMVWPLEDDLESYINHSPILQAQNINTPLLLIHGEKDQNVPFYHSTQLFMQLRSMGKKVWLAAYDDYHTFINQRNINDCSFRIISFFDHYLNGRPKPEWLKKHIPIK
jgi:dipeptidyl aminopeptidase/acylaminoacyl peptidase